MQSVAEYHFCTYFDRNYFTRGLALYHSLARHCRCQFNLWVLCFDDETHDMLSRLNLPGIHLISQQNFEANDAELVRTKAERSRVEYYWTCTPSLPLYVLRNNPEVKVITYLDADLYFYNDPKPIYDEFGNGSILIIEHRYAPEYAHLAANAGIYNVGILAFRRDEWGLKCLHWWRNRCLEWCYQRPENGKFGDQKYLDDWPERFRGVVVLQHKGAGLAPWNLSRYQITSNCDKITVDEQSLIFYHFHSYKIISHRIVIPTYYGYQVPIRLLLLLYFPYAAALQRADSQVASLLSSIKAASMPTQNITLDVLEQRLLFVGPRLFAIILWLIGGLLSSSKIKTEAGFRAYVSGDLRACRQQLLAALCRNPLLLRQRRVLSILLETFVGSNPNESLPSGRQVHSRKSAAIVDT